LVDEIILYYDAPSKKHQNTTKVYSLHRTTSFDLPQEILRFTVGQSSCETEDDLDRSKRVVLYNK